jgi:hypothetical protein
MRTTSATAWAELPQPFLAREAAAVGLTADSISGALRRRQIVGVAPSVYVVPQIWAALTPEGLHRAMTRAASVSVAPAVVSHQSAALLHDLPHPLGPLGPVSLTMPTSSRTANRDDWRRFLDGELPDEHIVDLAGIRVTRADRTVIDCFRQLRLRDALAIADGALRVGLTDRDALRRMRLFQRRWPGVTKADLGLRLADRRRESWLESASVATAHALGFPVPMSQVWIHRPDGELVGRVDALWMKAGVVGEADGRGKYLGAYADDEWDAARASDHMLAERDRERALEALGFAVARWGTADVLSGGRGLRQQLQLAGRRADPSRIRCLWRQDVDDALKPWSPELLHHDAGPDSAA